MLKLIFNGVQLNILPRHRSLLLYSTASISTEQPAHSMVDYLVDSLGFSREEALAASKRVSRLKSPSKPDSIVNFFKQIGLTQSQIKSIASYDAQLITIRDIDKTLIPKIRLFQGLGLSGSELGRVLAANPSVLSRSLETHIKPVIECLRSILGSDENVIKAIKRSSMLINHGVKRILPNTLLLKGYGLSEERIRKLALYNPRHLFVQTQILEGYLLGVETKLRIPRESQMFIHGIHVISSITKETLESKFQLYKSYGWTENDIMTLVRKLPCSVKLSEAKIRSGLDYFMKELNYSPDYISRFPSLLSYSLENRVLPRRTLWEALMKKKLITSKFSFCSFVYISERQFLNVFLIPFEDKFPKLFVANIRKRLSRSSSIAVTK